MSEEPAELCIAYYSRSGHSRRLAKRLAAELQADLVEIIAPIYEGRIFGYIRAGFESLRQKAVLAPQSFNSLTGYGQVILVGPVWTSYPAVPLRALMRREDALPQAVSLFLTSGAHSPPEKAFATGASDLGRPFVVTAVLPNSVEGTPRETGVISQFLMELAGSEGSATAH